MSVVAEYLKAHETAWAPTTMKSEASRLRAFSPSESPQELFDRVSKELKPYAVKTLFIRIAHMEKWAKAQWGYDEFMRTHRNKFKHAYERKEIGISFETAVERIDKLAEPYRDASRDLLKTGVRISESYSVRDGKVTGKGGKTRRVYGTIRAEVPARELRAQLKAVGLKPHDLRKLCATRLAERGATAADLCAIFGWSSISTAFRYLQPRDEARLSALVEEATKGP